MENQITPLKKTNKFSKKKVSICLGRVLPMRKKNAYTNPTNGRS
jgi:hypothetical protein